MEKIIHNEVISDKSVFAEYGLEFQDCRLENIDLTAMDFCMYVFEDCVFDKCNLSLVKFNNARLNGVSFKDCKLMGIDFTQVDKLFLELKFEKCNISQCNFSFLELKGVSFDSSDLTAVDFVDSMLKKASFKNVKFKDVTFHNSDLRESNFTGAQGYFINPYNNNIKKAAFNLPEAVALLQGLGIRLK